MTTTAENLPDLTPEQENLIHAHMVDAEKGAASHARRYRPIIEAGLMDLDDLRSAAFFGLVLAARKYDPNRGTRFMTIAFPWIERELHRCRMRALRENGWAYGPNRADREAGRVPERGKMIACAIRVPWGDADHREDGGPRLDQIPDPACLAEVEDIERRDHVQYLRAVAVAACPTARDRTILERRMQDETVREIAASLNLTRVRVGQLFTAIVNRARTSINVSAPRLQMPRAGTSSVSR